MRELLQRAMSTTDESGNIVVPAAASSVPMQGRGDAPAQTTGTAVEVPSGTIALPDIPAIPTETETPAGLKELTEE